MAKPGRKPIPPEIHILRGNPGKRPLKETLKSNREIGGPPAHLTEQQKRDWRSAVKHAPPGLLTATDIAPLVVWVVAYDTHRQALRAIENRGLVTIGAAGNEVISPYVRIMDKQAEIMLRAASELGFTPSARCRVVAVIRPQPVANKFENNGVPV